MGVNFVTSVKNCARLLADITVPLVVVGACVALYRLGIMYLLENMSPLGDVQLTVLRRLGVMASLLIGYLVVARYYERRPVTELAFKPLAISISGVLGLLLIGVTILCLYAFGYYQFHLVRGYSVALPIFGAILVGVLVEEIIFRGVVFRLLEQHTGTIRALLIQAPVFGALHIFNEGASLMTVLSVTLLGAFWAGIYVYSRNLWVVIANHATWNVTIFLSGAPLSGQKEWTRSSPFETSYEGPSWLTGGGFGPEDSIINILVMACALGGLIYWGSRTGRFLKGSWADSESS